MWKTPASWVFSHPLVWGVPCCLFSHWRYLRSKLEPISYSQIALLWNTLLCLWDAGKTLLLFVNGAVLQSYMVISSYWKVKTAIDANYQFGIFWFNKKLLLLCWTNTLRTFSRFPLWDLAFVHKHTTLQSFTLPHTSTTVIQTAERWERLRINCSCMKPFINNAYCCFLLLPTAVRG